MQPFRKLWLLVLLLSFLLAWRTAWQSTLLAAPQLETAKCTIEGIVTSITTGAPLKGARVRLTAVGSYKPLYRTETDATGRFSLSAVEAGKYTLRISKDGYDSPDPDCNSDAVQDGDEITLVSGQKLSGLKFQLLAPAVITGTVFDPSGDPLAGADVEVVKFYSSGGERFISSATEPARTDDRGQYRIFDLKPGQYFLRVSDAFYFFRQQFEEDSDENTAATKAGTEKQGKGFLPIYYPDTTDLSQATLLELKPGEELAGFDFTIHSAQVLQIRGRVVNGLTAEPISNASAGAELLRPGIRENNASASRTGDSHFQIDNLVPGRYKVFASASNLPDRKRWGGWQEIELTDSSVDDVLLRVFPGHDLQGRIRVLGDQKVDLPRVQIVLEPQGEFGYGIAFTNANADGSFLLLDALQDTFDIDVHGLPEGYYLKSAHWGSVAVTDDGLRIGGEPPTAPLILEVSPAAAQAEGVVQAPNGKPACNATVVLIPDAPRRSIHRYYQSTDVDRSGHYTLKGIPPGSYKLFGFDHADEVGYLDPASLQPYENSGQPVHFDEGDRRTVQLKLIPTTTSNP